MQKTHSKENVTRNFLYITTSESPFISHLVTIINNTTSSIFASNSTHSSYNSKDLADYSGNEALHTSTNDSLEGGKSNETYLSDNRPFNIETNTPSSHIRVNTETVRFMTTSKQRALNSFGNYSSDLNNNKSISQTQGDLSTRSMSLNPTESTVNGILRDKLEGRSLFLPDINNESTSLPITPIGKMESLNEFSRLLPRSDYNNLTSNSNIQDIPGHNSSMTTFRTPVLNIESLGSSKRSELTITPQNIVSSSTEKNERPHLRRGKGKKIRHLVRKTKKETLDYNDQDQSVSLERSSLLPDTTSDLLIGGKGTALSLQREVKSRLRHKDTSLQRNNFTSLKSTLSPHVMVNTTSNLVSTPQYRKKSLESVPSDQNSEQNKQPGNHAFGKRKKEPIGASKPRAETVVSRENNSSICFVNDPCGIGVACHPTDTGFICLCEDSTRVNPGQSCPMNKAVNLTPPAIVAPGPKTDPVPNWPSQGFLLGAVISMAACICFLLVLLYWRRKYIYKLMSKRSAAKLNRTSVENVFKKSPLHEFNFASNPNYYTSPPDQLPLQSLSVQHIAKEDITHLGDLGEGCFGRVYKGELTPSPASDCEEDESERTHESSLEENEEGKKEITEEEFEKNRKKGKKKGQIVAVKVLKEPVGSEAEADFLREVEIMSSFRHPNILSLIGVVVADIGRTPWMVFEFMPYGDLAEVLRSSNNQYPANYVLMKPLNKVDLLNIGLQVALGMEYLSNQHFVHRDLACRNCLVGENLTVKISDFGMSRDVYTCDYYKVGGSRMLPVRWMAPESILYGKFTLESDVWSFGVVLWEVYTYGKQPYYGYSNEEVVQLIRQGNLLTPPDSCPQLVRDVMNRCWSPEAHHRLTFPEIVHQLNRAEEELQKEEIFQGLFQELNYSQLCMHESAEQFQTDADHYLLPTSATHSPNKDEYLTILGDP